MSNPEDGAPKGVSRRTVTKAIAWSVPAVAVAASVPIAAASCVPTISLSQRSCKCPGQSTNSPFTYHLEICAGGQSCPQSSIVITITSIVTGSQGETIWQGSQDLTANTCHVFTGSASNSGNWIYVYYEISGVAQATPVQLASPPNCDKVQNPISTC